MSDKKLSKLFVKYGSDNDALGYTKYLEPYCNRLKNEKFDLLEIGIGGHNINLPYVGLHAWHNYFQKSNIYGLDVIDKSNYNQNRITTIKGSQSSLKTINKIKKITKNLKIVFDDGSHLPNHQIFTFLNLFPHMKPGGFYAIADIEYSYSNTYASTNINNKKNILNFFKSIIHYVNSDLILDDYLNNKEVFDSIKSLQFHHGLIIIEKGENKPKQIKYMKLLGLSKKKHFISQKKNKIGKIKYLKKKENKEKNITYSSSHDTMKNLNIFIPEETSFIENKKGNELEIKIKFPKKIQIQFYKIYPSIYTPLRAPSSWCIKILLNKKILFKQKKELKYIEDLDNYFKFKKSFMVDEIQFKFSKNFNFLNTKNENFIRILKKKIKKVIKKNITLNNKVKFNDIIRISRIEFYDIKRKNILNQKVDKNFVKNFKVIVKES